MAHGILLFALLLVAGVGMCVLWIVSVVFGAIARALGALFRSLGFTSTPRRMEQSLYCTHLRCGASNPREARFCRRCGSPLHGSPQSIRQPDPIPHARVAEIRA